VGGDAALATLSQRDHEAVTAAAMAKVLGVLAQAPTGRGRCGGRCALLCGRLDWDFPRKRLFLSRNIEGATGAGRADVDYLMELFCHSWKTIPFFAGLCACSRCHRPQSCRSRRLLTFWLGHSLLSCLRMSSS
jgi:hypothetical protein